MPELDRMAPLDPARSCVVEACAGSGKTWQLAARMLRLLLAGAEPGTILALTFTRKAAQEMRERLEDWLAILATAPDEEAVAFLVERGLDTGQAHALLPRARLLHERVLTAQPPMAIDTFHGWFLRIVSLAPLSPPGAGGAQRVSVPHGASLVEQTGALVAEAWQRFAAMLGREPESAPAQAFVRLLERLGLAGVREALGAFVARRAEWWAFTDGQDDPAGHAHARLKAQLGCDVDALPARDFFAGRLEMLGEYAALLARNTVSDREGAAALSVVLEAGRFDEEALDALGVLWLRKDGGPRAARKASGAQAGRLGGDGESRLLELDRTLAAAYLDARETLLGQSILALNTDLFVCADAFIAELQRLKATRALLDFNDIEWMAAHSLTRADHAAYLHARLDARYRHLLLDEFQDTNPLQWAALRGWLEAYGGDGDRPSVLMVGDPKQSIYRFRRADARLFDAAGAWLGRSWQALRVERNHTRRNALPVVEVVNRVFDQLAGFGHFSPQTTEQAGLPGRVEVLPLVERADPPPLPPRERLRDPLGEAREEPRDERRLAEGRCLAARLAELVGHMRVPARDGARPATWGDVMILARKRAVFAEIEAALREKRIPFASARGGGLLETLEVEDMLALLGFIVAPDDDLKLAQALKAPLFGAGDADLALIAAGERSVSWWRRLCGLAQPPASLARARDLCREWRTLADILPVHDLLDRIYHQGEVKARYAASVPAAAAPRVLSNLDALVALALAQDAGRFPSLTRFLDELKAARRGPDEEAPDEGEADAASAGDVVRMLTIHGAKGLEAPIVCLVDAHAAGAKAESRDLLIDWPPEAGSPTHVSFLTRRAEAGRSRADLLAQSQAAAEREELNLLYVAMTRAQQVLLVSGSERQGASDRSAWSLVRKAVEGLTGGTPDARRVAGWGELAWMAPGPAVSAATDAPRAAPRIAPVPIGVRRPRDTPEQRDGVALHAVLQWLAEARDAGLASPDDATLARQTGLRADQVAGYRARAHAAMGAAHLTRFFDPAAFRRAWNEFEVVSAAGTRRLDRLVEFEGEVWVLDYKRRLGAKDMEAYCAQVRDYLALVDALHPGRRVRGALVDLERLELLEVLPQ